jgi:hypothetical protein
LNYAVYVFGFHARMKGKGQFFACPGFGLREVAFLVAEALFPVRLERNDRRVMDLRTDALRVERGLDGIALARIGRGAQSSLLWL